MLLAGIVVRMVTRICFSWKIMTGLEGLPLCSLTARSCMSSHERNYVQYRNYFLLFFCLEIISITGEKLLALSQQRGTAPFTAWFAVQRCKEVIDQLLVPILWAVLFWIIALSLSGGKFYFLDSFFEKPVRNYKKNWIWLKFKPEHHIEVFCFFKILLLVAS